MFDNTYHLEDQLHFGNDSRLVGVKGKAVGGGCSSRGSVGTLMLDSKQHKRVDRKQDLKGWVDNNVEDDDVLPTPDYDSGELPSTSFLWLSLIDVLWVVTVVVVVVVHSCLVNSYSVFGDNVFVTQLLNEW